MHDRLIPFERVLNFRDFGGYDTPSGRVVRGKLYRSASFHDASEADIDRLDAMNVAVMVDLRRPEERAHEPNKWPSDPARVVFNDEGAAIGLPPHLQALLQSDLSAGSVAEYMRTLYREFPFDPRLVQLYSVWFRRLTSNEGAALIHCAAGKDRTGLICALTLLALDVDEEVVFADYEFTNQAVNIEARLPRIKRRMEERLGRTLDPDALRPMLGVDVNYLRASFEAIEAKHTDVRAYLRDVLGVGEVEREALRAKLVE
jgi:protein-tyrosine phosphatase